MFTSKIRFPFPGQRLLGHGDLPIAATVKALRNAGYGGFYCLETEKRWQPTAPSPEESLPNFAEFMRKV